ncbi:MAG: hypothetical protein K1X82_14505 [Bacteroidia bacterium]|nr:hypothetical protein [Bacteroidia bacterium]
MKRIQLIYLLILYLIVSCKKESIQKSKIEYTYSYDTLSSNDYTFINNFKNFDSIYYHCNELDSTILLTNFKSSIYSKIDTNYNNVISYYNYYYIDYISDSKIINRLYYSLFGRYPDIDTISKNFGILIENDAKCYSSHNFSTINPYEMNSIQLNGKIFNDCYHSVLPPWDCSSELYYNKQYGVVAFKWEDNWWVLETDSL